MSCDLASVWPIYVSYKVQQGDALLNLLKKANMNKREWDFLNRTHPSEQSLRAGDTVVIFDPIATCQSAEWHAQGCLEGISPKWINYRCEESNSAFKPLRAFTKPLWAKK